MYLSPEEMALVRKSTVYDAITKTAWSSHTYAGLLAYIDAMTTTPGEPKEFAVMKWLMTLIEAKRIENAEQSQINEEVFAAIIEGGGTPSESSYPLKTSAMITGTVAGGAGAFAAATALAAVASKSLFIEEILLSLTTDTASGGIQIRLNDGAGGTTFLDVIISIYQPTITYRPLKTLTSATLLEWVGLAAKNAALDDNDYVKGRIKYREI